MFNIGDVRTRHCNNLNCENTKSFSNDPEDPSAAALKVCLFTSIVEFMKLFLTFNFLSV